VKIVIEIESGEVKGPEYSPYEKKWWDEHDTTSEHGGV
jgi:hypothetical protein|tara:strand:+ start:554 stop:667 length:114 start_codon:yes stop_codon:yes gene_type:complete